MSGYRERCPNKAFSALVDKKISRITCHFKDLLKTAPKRLMRRTNPIGNHLPDQRRIMPPRNGLVVGKAFKNERKIII